MGRERRGEEASRGKGRKERREEKSKARHGDGRGDHWTGLISPAPDIYWPYF
jgi:hypothetical protein